ncbi:MAG: hypothetical protein RL077_3156 [Verrucomicrobiota bacterium]
MRAAQPLVGSPGGAMLWPPEFQSGRISAAGNWTGLTFSRLAVRMSGPEAPPSGRAATARGACAQTSRLKQKRYVFIARPQTPKPDPVRLHAKPDPVRLHGEAARRAGGHNGQRGNGYRQSSTLKPGTRLKWASRVATGQSCSTASAAIHRSFSGVGAPARARAPRNRA